MAYALAQPPLTGTFEEMSNKELRAYARWFHDLIPERLYELSQAVASTAGFEEWEVDYSEASLDPLGGWYKGQVETRPRTDAEMAELTSRLQGWNIEVANYELTNRTYSLALDIGMYLASVLFWNQPGLRWELPLRSKRFIDHGQPIIRGSSKVGMNPVHLPVVRAHTIASGGERTSLRELYDICVKQLTASRTHG